MSVSHFPHGAHFSADQEPACTLWWVRTRLGRGEMSDPRFVAYVQGLVDECGFPPPFPSKLKGQPLTRAVTAHSTFRRDAVEAWIDSFLPPACAASLDAQAMRAAAEDLDARAAQLGNLKLIDGGRA